MQKPEWAGEMTERWVDQDGRVHCRLPEASRDVVLVEGEWKRMVFYGEEYAAYGARIQSE